MLSTGVDTEDGRAGPDRTSIQRSPEGVGAVVRRARGGGPIDAFAVAVVLALTLASTGGSPTVWLEPAAACGAPVTTTAPAAAPPEATTVPGTTPTTVPVRAATTPTTRPAVVTTIPPTVPPTVARTVPPTVAPTTQPTVAKTPPPTTPPTVATTFGTVVGLVSPGVQATPSSAPGPLQAAPAAARAQAAACPPLAVLIARPPVGAAPLAVVFDGSGSAPGTDDGTTRLVSWELAFGDGGSTGGPGTPPPAVPHTFPAPGQFEAALTVTDDAAVAVTARATVIAGLASLSVDRPTLGPGDPVTATGSGCDPGAPVDLRVGEDLVGTAVAGPDGRFTTPLDSRPVEVGAHQLVAACGPMLVTPLTVVLAAVVDEGGSAVLVVLAMVLVCLTWIATSGLWRAGPGEEGG
jgi:hypothetical protein